LNGSTASANRRRTSSGWSGECKLNVSYGTKGIARRIVPRKRNAAEVYASREWDYSRIKDDGRHDGPERTTADPGRLFCSNWSKLPQGQIGGNVEVYLERREASFTVHVIADNSRQSCEVLAAIRDLMTRGIEPARVAYRGAACIKRP
jgi:hypothetical protein